MKNQVVKKVMKTMRTRKKRLIDEKLQKVVKAMRMMRMKKITRKTMRTMIWKLRRTREKPRKAMKRWKRAKWKKEERRYVESRAVNLPSSPHYQLPGRCRQSMSPARAETTASKCLRLRNLVHLPPLAGLPQVEENPGPVIGQTL